MDKYIGRLLDSRYEILEVIGTGGMAVVYKARCHRLNRLVAIKILKDDYLEDEDFRRRFHAESQAVAMVSHPNIVSVYDVSTSVSMEADYIVMELIEGITLKQYMEKKGVLNWKETLHFATQIAKALEHAHSRGIVHRDIKPHNVMVLKNGSVKVADFGIARLMAKGDTLTKEALGSVHYISPEQAKGGRVDNRSDLYSLGVVMYEMMTGRPPYEGESPVSVAIQHISGGAKMPSTLNPNIPGGMEQIIMKAMAHEPKDRYETATQMLNDMEEFRKNPAILFDYNAPPTDDVLKLGSTPAAAIEANAVRAAADRANAREDEKPKRKPKAEKQEKPEPKPKTKAKPEPEPKVKNVPAKKQQTKPAREERPESRGSSVATAAIIACAVVAIVAIAIFLFSLFGEPLANEAKKVQVPSLIGKHFDSIPSIEPYTNFVIEQYGKGEYNEDYEAGRIIRQNPDAGERIEKGSSIFVVISLGPAPANISMPNLVGMQKEAATAKLINMGLNLDIKIEEQPHLTIPEGCIISTDPGMDTALQLNQKITLYVSTGKPQEEIKVVTMVNLVGYDLRTVQNILNGYGFPAPEIKSEEYSNLYPAGTVIGASVKKGDKVSVDTVIKVVLSMGPEPTTAPPPTDPPTAPPTAPPTTKPPTTVPPTEAPESGE